MKKSNQNPIATPSRAAENEQTLRLFSQHLAAATPRCEDSPTTTSATDKVAKAIKSAAARAHRKEKK